MSSLDFFKSYFICRQRSDCRMAFLSKVSTAPLDSSKKYAVGLRCGVFWLKNSACNLGMCLLTASSACFCMRESMVVYIFSPSLYKLHLLPSGLGLFLIQSLIKPSK